MSKSTCGKAGIAAVATLLTVLVLPQDVSAQGESAVPFLLIAPDSRSSGIGESGTGSVEDVSAIYWNPGALAFMDGQEVSITHANWLPQFQLPDLFYDHLNYRQRIDAIGGTIGASVTYLSLGEFQITGSNGPEVIGTFRSYEYAVTAGYATKATDDLGLGVNLRFIHSALSPVGTEAEKGNGITSTMSVDLAMMWRPQTLEVPLIGDIGKQFSLGVNLSNLGPKVTYVDAAQADPLPTNLRVGFGYRIFSDEYNSLEASLDFSRLLVRRHDDGTSDALPKSLITAWGSGGIRKVITCGGMEYWYGAPKLIALRIGYFYEDPNFGNRKFLTFGAGIRYDIYGFDFSYISAGPDEPLSDTIRFSLRISWGGSEGESSSK
ncbi:MAG TPA: PorV/PorQ family protein [Bacteroidota bacterium]|nr:PorV/PorQ family protein [Bacteroidota bacterium]